jgi:hypothetical protein
MRAPQTINGFILSLPAYLLIDSDFVLKNNSISNLYNRSMIQKITAAITAVGGFVPEDKLTNADLEKIVDTNDEWIRTRTGIEERRILKGEKGTSDLIVPAVKQILEKRGITPGKSMPLLLERLPRI